MRSPNRHTPTKHRRLAVLLAVICAFAGLPDVPALAQNGSSPAQLRRENDRLRERISELEAALEESDRRIVRLESQINAMLKAQAELASQAETKSETPPEMPKKRRLPDDPAACPDSLFNSLRDNYNEMFPEIGRLPDYTEVQRWTRLIARNRQPVTWRVRVLETSAGENDQPELVVNVVDPETGDDLGARFRLPVSSAFAERIRNATEVRLWEFTGMFAANPVTDPDRPVFDDTVSPKLIGPYAVFGWSFEVQGINPAGRESDPDEANPPRR